MAPTRAFTRKSWYQAVNAWRLIKEQPKFKVIFILSFAVVCEAGLYFMFRHGFHYLGRLDAIAGLITGRLFSLFFLGMGIMLVMSGMVTAFASLYRSAEVPYLLTKPMSLSRIVVLKFVESTHFSSWAFVFIILPYVAAYASHEHLSARFAFCTLVFSVPFLFLCSGIGSLVIILAVRWLPHRVSLRMAGWGLLAAASVLIIRFASQEKELKEAAFTLSALIPGMKLAGNALIPSTWVAEGIQAVARGQWGTGSIYFGVLTMTALTLTTGVEWIGSRTFQASWEKLEMGRGKQSGTSRAFRIGDVLLGFLRSDVRAMVMKDFRTFCRDAMQWSQALIFFGLLGIYFGNIRSLDYHTYSPMWRNMVAFLNVFSVSAVLCSLGSRFIYPQLSLEGQGFWLLGLSPTRMKRVLLSKFFSAVVSLSLASVALIGLSSSMLQTEGSVLVMSLVLMACISFSVCGLSTGLGAIFMDLRQRNPAAIVGNFGGTLNLVLSLGLMLATIVPAGVLFHMNSQEVIAGGDFRIGLIALLAWLAVLTCLFTVTPLVMGLRSLENRDY